MRNLDDFEQIKRLDPKDVWGSNEKFLEQCIQIHETVSAYNFKQSFEDVENIVFSGMGGSSYGAYVASALYKYLLDIPVIINNDYDLPEFVDEKTLVIVSSYSGSTEEALSALDEAKTRGSKIITLSSGGKLFEAVDKTGFDGVSFDPVHNPSGQPRLGTGYMVLGIVEILNKIHMIDIESETITKAIDEAATVQDEIREKSKDLAKRIEGKIPVIFASGHLCGNAHILRNQFNETAKSFASYHIVPEANHHLLEGLKNPVDRKLITILLESGLYSDKVKERMSLTREVIEKNECEAYSYELKCENALSQILEILILGGYVTFYLAMLYDQDPSVIPWVDYFKQKLRS